MPEIAETLVIGVELPQDGYWLGLFVVPNPGHALDDALTQRITTALRTQLPPRHVTDEIVQAPIDDPDTLRWYEQFAAKRRNPSP